MAPIEDITTSKDSSSNGRFSASASTQSSSTPSDCARGAAGVEQLGREVARRDLRAALSGHDRGVAGPGGHVEDAHALADPGRVDEPRAQRKQERLDHRRVVARRPHLAVRAFSSVSAVLDVTEGSLPSVCTPTVTTPGTMSTRHIPIWVYDVPRGKSSDDSGCVQRRGRAAASNRSSTPSPTGSARSTTWCDALGMAQPQVSKHLRVLREVGAVEVRDEGRQRLYRLNGRALKPIHDWVKTYERSWSERFEAAGRRPGRTQTEGARRWQWRVVERRRSPFRPTIRSSSRASSTRRGSSSSRRGPRPSWSRAGGPGKRGGVTSAEIDLRVGGIWRYVMEANEGFEVAFHGEYQEIVPEPAHREPPRCSRACPAPRPSTPSRSPRRTAARTLHVLVQHTSKEHRDGHIESGMEGGMQESMDPLEQVAISLR